MKRPETWQQHVALAEHYLAIGQDEIYLSDTDDLPLAIFPWEFVTSIEKGSTFRHGVDVSKWFRAVHPCGLRFRWCLDLEVRDANGTGTLKFDFPKLRQVLALLPAKYAKQYRESFADARKQLQKQADEYHAIGNRLDHDAADLEF
jgi:hypothetical protein